MDEKANACLIGSNNANIQQSSDNANARLHLYLIGEDGCINYPYVGKIQMLGLESREAKNVMEDKLSNMLHNFSVDVKLMNRTFSVIGEAGSGRYQIPKEKLNIFQALAMSGDMSTYSDRKKIQLIRQTEQGTVVKHLTFVVNPSSIRVLLYLPNDVIYVPFDGALFWCYSFYRYLSLVILHYRLVMIYGIVKPK